MRQAKNLRLQREQLERKLRPLRETNLSIPPRGWIRTIRESLGMSAAQLAKRLDMPRQNLYRIEANEKTGNVSMATLKKIADALSCDLQVTLVPREPLQLLLEKRALEIAKKAVERTHLHMSLESQQTDLAFIQKQIQEMADELVRELDKKLWETS